MEVSIILAVLLIVEGIYSLATGKMVGNTSRREAKYTEESTRKYYRICGGFLLFYGAMVIVLKCELLPLDHDLSRIIALFLIAIGVVLMLILGKVVLVKKGAASSKKNVTDYYEE